MPTTGRTCSSRWMCRDGTLATDEVVEHAVLCARDASLVPLLSLRLSLADMKSPYPIFQPLYDEYERQKVICAKQGEQYVQNLEALAKEHPELLPNVQRLLAIHFGWDLGS